MQPSTVIKGRVIGWRVSLGKEGSQPQFTLSFHLKKKSIKTWGENDCTLDRKKNMTTQQCSVSPAKSLPRFTDFTFKNGFNILIYAIASARKESFSQMRREGVR